MFPERRAYSRRRKIVVIDRTARRAVRSALVWGAVFAISVANSAYAYATTYPTVASRLKLANSFAGNAGFNAVFGTARRLQTVAGFTAWRTMGFLTILGAVWALLLTTRLTRGEEDAGRWELLLCGATTRGGAAAQAAAGVGAGLATLWAVTATVAAVIGSTPRVGFSVSASLFLAAALIGGAALFAGVGLLAGQLAGSRRQANAIGAGVLGGCFLVRMVADSGSHLAWLRWATPLGWLENLRPLTGSDPVALVPIGLTLVATVSAAITVAARRDLGGSVLSSSDDRAPHLGLLGSSMGLTIRLVRAVDLAWIAGLGILGLVLGLVAQSASAAINASTSIEKAIRRLGGYRGGAATYLGIAFLIAAALVAFAAAAQISATRAEEAEGRLEHLLVRTVPRWQWLATRLGVGAGLVVVASLFTGVASWVGAASQHSGVSIGDLAQAGLNIAPPGLFVLGLGAVVFGVAPRLASGIVYAVVAWSLLIEVIASVVQSNRILLDSSVLSHLAPAPAASPNWTAAAWLSGLGLLGAVIGIVAFHRRDLVPA
jgi:ABC-2 type transport system permease protein